MPFNEMSLILDDARTVPAVRRFQNPFRRRFDLGLFSSALSRLLAGGVPLLQALQVLKDAFSHPREKKIFKKIREEIRQGRSFSEVLSEEPGAFPGYFVQVVRTGEISGTLEAVLKQMAGELEKQSQARRKIREAISYPFLILALGIVTLDVILKKVLPKLTLLYGDLGGELPAVTRLILSMSHWFYPGLGIFIFILFFTGLMIHKKNEKMAAVFFRVPVFGKLLRKILLNRFSSFLSLLLKSGIPLLQGLEMTEKASGFELFRRDLRQLGTSLAEGRGLGVSFKEMEWMDKTSLALLRAGEEAGRLEESLAELSRSSEQEIDSQVQWMLKLLEPLLILAVGGVVGMIVIGTILPIFEMNGLVK